MSDVARRLERIESQQVNSGSPKTTPFQDLELKLPAKNKKEVIDLCKEINDKDLSNEMVRLALIIFLCQNK